MFVVLSLLGIHIHFDRSPGYDDHFHHVEVQYMLQWVSCASCHKQVGATGLQTLVGCYSESTGVLGFGMHHSTNPLACPGWRPCGAAWVELTSRWRLFNFFDQWLLEAGDLGPAGAVNCM